MVLSGAGRLLRRVHGSPFLAGQNAGDV